MARGAGKGEAEQFPSEDHVVFAIGNCFRQGLKVGRK